jgi:predicted DNA-binding protein (UPF0251 family)
VPRPLKCRRVGFVPEAVYFKPAGVPGRELLEVVLTLDELEALRLADLEGLYQEEAAARMEVSRQTFGNVVAAARRKAADCLVNGKMLRIEGGAVSAAGRGFSCQACRHRWSISFGEGRPRRCPACEGSDIRRRGGGPGSRE